MKQKFVVFSIILALVLIGAGAWRFSGFNMQEGEVPSDIKMEAPDEKPSATPPISSPESSIQNIQKFVIEGNEFSFSPNSIAVSRGATVEITFKNIGGARHNYVVDELGIATKTISSGDTDVVLFVAPDSADTFSYSSYCSVPGHRKAGMEGVIEIK